MYIMRDDGNVGVDLWYWQCICGGESGNTGNFRTGGRADSESVEGIHFCERCRKCSGIFRKASEKISGYTKDMIQAVDGLVLQVFYKSGDKEILIRKALISQGKDISGDYNVYDVTKKVSVKGKKRKVTIKGTEKKKNLAVWSDGTYSYSLYTSAGMSQKALIRLVKQVQ